ncbi:protein-export membrane protein SecF [Candidatus Adlerbacteria bacterium RIFCSPHIGHO2_12_FULL_53_18]|uniref:Protein-export membrane protein SecF n=1 Tax=Candidatus Adlerbacteria bacterium RIFCSPHIGHO2_12_FULL_53_18 TaxID=1797242 RepID=A0A1F4XUG1_9BACT|nr:MAG: protein-export membrane protein SecF [Candidatus Adlerbacteria bacterium RIFCSPHIGHO2_12_FULL_53_18]
MDIIRYQKYFFILPAILALLSAGAIGVWGLKVGIDLAGGSLLQVTYPDNRPDATDVRTVASGLSLGEVRVQETGEQAFILRQRDLTNDEHTAFLQALGTLGTVQEDQFTSVGPSLGQELMRKSWIAIALIVVSIILFIAFAFRHVSKPVSSWKYGIVAIVTLMHDILLPVGLFAFLGYTVGAEVDSLFIVALLTILGISINDTIVIFDRIRENLRRNEEARRSEEFEKVVGRSISQTITRSINTSVTVIIVLVALYFLGPEATKNFALTLIVGMIAGTYSSIFLASPLLVAWERWSRKSVQ